MDNKFDRMLNAVGPCTNHRLLCEYQSISNWKQFWKIFVHSSIHLHVDLLGV